jgi:hypothetical protein
MALAIEERFYNAYPGQTIAMGYGGKAIAFQAIVPSKIFSVSLVNVSRPRGDARPCYAAVVRDPLTGEQGKVIAMGRTSSHNDFVKIFSPPIVISPNYHLYLLIRGEAGDTVYFGYSVSQPLKFVEVYEIT